MKDGQPPNLFALFERLGEVSEGLRNLDASFRQAHGENSGRFSGIEEELKRVRHDGRDHQQVVTLRFEKIVQDAKSLTAKVAELEPAVRDIAALKIRLAAFTALGASLFCALAAFAEPVWHWLVEHVLDRFFPSHG